MWEKDGKMYHLQIRRGEVGRYVLLPGDPFRTDKIAQYLDNPVLVAHNREHKTWTGTLLGEKVSVVSTGMGCPSTAIAMEELIACGADTFIRVGTAGCMCPQLRAEDAVGGIVTAAVRDEGTTRQYVPLEYPAVADRHVVEALAGAASELGYRFDEGISYTKDSLYTHIAPETVPLGDTYLSRQKVWERARVLVTEMEAAAVLVLSSLRGCRASGIMAYSDVDDLPGAVDKEIQVACRAIRELIRKDREARGIRLVVSDVDGTLLDRSDTVTEGLQHLRELLREQKVPFTLASGRCYQNLRKLIGYLDITYPVIINNGTGIMTEAKLLYKKTLRASDVTQAVRYADEKGMYVSFFDENMETVYRWNSYVQTWVDRFGKEYRYYLAPDEPLDEEAWNRLEIHKLLVVDPQSPGRIDEVIRRIGNPEQVFAVKYDDRSCDIMPAGCDKSTGIVQLAAQLHISPQEILVIGDNENDIGMLGAAGIGAAVGNATEGLKNVAAYVSRAEAAEGVAEIITHYLGEIQR